MTDETPEPLMQEFLATAGLVIGGEHRAAGKVHMLRSDDPEVVSLFVAGYLVARNAEGEFPQPVVAPLRCCGQG